MENRQRHRRNEKNKRVKKFNKRLNIIFFISTIVTLFLIVAFVRQRIKIANLNKEYQLLQAQEENMKNQIEDLVKEIQIVNSLEYIEKKAREDLGMIKKDENIYVNSDETDNESNEESNEESFGETNEESSNETTD